MESGDMSVCVASKVPVAFRTSKVSSLCTRVCIDWGCWNVARKIGRDQGCHIVNGRVHGFKCQLRLSVAPVIYQSIKALLQCDPWPVYLQV